MNDIMIKRGVWGTHIQKLRKDKDINIVIRGQRFDLQYEAYARNALYLYKALSWAAKEQTMESKSPSPSPLIKTKQKTKEAKW